MKSLITASIVISLLCGMAYAEIPLTMSYQGRVTDTGGTPVADGTYPMRFQIYDAFAAGTLLWDSGNQMINLADGVFNVYLGVSPQPELNLPFDGYYWLQVAFNGTIQSPRVRVSSTGYAYMASGLVPGTEVSGAVSTYPSSVITAINTGTTGGAQGLRGISSAPYGAGVFGNSSYNGEAYGVYGSGYIGVRGSSGTLDGKGVYGTSTHATAGVGVAGYANGDGGGCGVHGWAQATTGWAVGVFGATDSPMAYGVYYSGGLGGFGVMHNLAQTKEGPVALDVVTSAGAWVEDFGEGVLQGGRASVQLEPRFLETVTVDDAHPMKVFVQLRDGTCQGVAVQKGLAGFDVLELNGGKSNAQFDYHIVARKKGFEDTRLELIDEIYGGPCHSPENAAGVPGR